MHTMLQTTITTVNIIKALKCKPSAQFAYNYSVNVLSKCSNIISHRSSIFEGRHIDLQKLVDTSTFEGRQIDHRSSKVNTSISEGRHIDLRRLTHHSSKIEGRNIAPTTQQRTDNSSPINCQQRRSIVLY